MSSEQPQLEASDDVTDGGVESVQVDGALFVAHHEEVDVALHLLRVRDVHRRRRLPSPGAFVDAA